MKHKRLLISVILLCLTSLAFAESKQNDKQYQTGKVVGIAKKAHERVLYYQGNDPITKDDPYYEVSIQIGDTVYTGEYSPPQFGFNPIDGEWKIDESVKVRTEKHRFHAYPPHGRELDFVITKKKPAETMPSTPNPAP